MQESGLLEIIPLISTLTRASILCLKSVLQVAGAVTKDLIMGNLISSRIPPGLWMDAMAYDLMTAASYV